VAPPSPPSRPAGPAATVRGVADLVAGVVPADERERGDQRRCLDWLAATADIYRRVKPATPDIHLVAYVLPVDRVSRSVLLVDHRLAGLWLPPGGHVEPGEDPAETARREAREELGIDADFGVAGDRPFFVSVTRTVPAAGPHAAAADRAAHVPHTDVSLWYLVAGERGMRLEFDEREFAGGRWWRAGEIGAADPEIFDPCLGRCLEKIFGASGPRAG